MSCDGRHLRPKGSGKKRRGKARESQKICVQNQPIGLGFRFGLGFASGSMWQTVIINFCLGVLSNFIFIFFSARKHLFQTLRRASSAGMACRHLWSTSYPPCRSGKLSYCCSSCAALPPVRWGPWPADTCATCMWVMCQVCHMHVCQVCHMHVGRVSGLSHACVSCVRFVKCMCILCQLCHMHVYHVSHVRLL